MNTGTARAAVSARTSRRIAVVTIAVLRICSACAFWQWGRMGKRWDYASCQALGDAMLSGPAALDHVRVDRGLASKHWIGPEAVS